MSKSLARVTAALSAAGLDIRPLDMPAETRTAPHALIRLTGARVADFCHSES